MIPIGYSQLLPLVNYPRRGVIHQFSDMGVPVLNISNVAKLATLYDLPSSPSPLPEPGDGSLYTEERYNVLVSFISLLIVVIALIGVLFFDRRIQQLDRPGVDPDTLV